MASYDVKTPSEPFNSGDESEDKKFDFGEGKRPALAGEEFPTEVEVSRGHLADSLEPHDSYEGKHRWDPTATWTQAEENAVVRKTDLYLLTWICIMFFGLQLGLFLEGVLDAETKD